MPLEIMCKSPYFTRRIEDGDTLEIGEVQPPLKAHCQADASFGNLRHRSGEAQVSITDPETVLIIKGRRRGEDVLVDRLIDISVRLFKD